MTSPIHVCVLACVRACVCVCVRARSCVCAIFTFCLNIVPLELLPTKHLTNLYDPQRKCGERTSL